MASLEWQREWARIRERSDRAMEQLDAAEPGSREAFAAFCALAEAKGQPPLLQAVAGAFGLPEPSKAAREAYAGDVRSGRIRPGTTGEQVRELFDHYASSRGGPAPARPASRRPTQDHSFPINLSRSERASARARERSRSLAPSEASATAERSPRPSWWIGGEHDHGPEARSNGRHEIHELPRLRAAKQPVTVRFSDDAWRALREFAQASEDGTETAGYLYGPHLHSWDRCAVINRVIEAAKDRGEDHVRFNGMKALEEHASIKRQEADGHYGEVGSFHTHPSGGKAPSPEDLSSWLTHADLIGRPYVGVILTPGRTRTDQWGGVLGSGLNFSDLTAHAWVVRRDENGWSQYEAAQVEW